MRGSSMDEIKTSGFVKISIEVEFRDNVVDILNVEKLLSRIGGGTKEVIVGELEALGEDTKKMTVRMKTECEFPYS
jgi:hypothetical protein